MKETPAQYTRRILANVNRRDAARIQKATPRKIERAIRGLTRKQMMTRPASDRWSIGEILAHLADAELVGGYRMRMILSSNGTPIQAFDQDVWAKTNNYAGQDPLRSFETFRVLREHNLRLLGSVPAKLRNHYGVHEERGKETIDRVTQMYAGHDINHLRQIEAIAKELKN